MLLYTIFSGNHTSMNIGDVISADSGGSDKINATGNNLSNNTLS